MLVPLIVSLLIDGRFGLVFALFVLAGVSDGVDGFIAKRFNRATTLGAYLDPIADKALLVSIFVALGALGHLPVWLVAIVVSRDILIVGAIVLSFLMGHPQKIRPLWISKLNTLLQIVLAATVLASLAFPQVSELVEATAAFVLAVTATTVLSGAVYLVLWYRSISRLEAGRGD